MRSVPDLLADDLADDCGHAGDTGAVFDGLATLVEAIGPRPAWMADAACRGQVDLMFPAHGSNGQAGKDLCDGCPVRDDCSTWATEHPGQGGILAGLSERQRSRLRAAA